MQKVIIMSSGQQQPDTPVVVKVAGFVAGRTAGAMIEIEMPGAANRAAGIMGIQKLRAVAEQSAGCVKNRHFSKQAGPVGDETFVDGN